MDLKKTEVGSITKGATFKSLLKHNYFFVTLFLIIFTRQTLTDDFWRVIQIYELRVSFKNVNILRVLQLWACTSGTSVQSRNYCFEDQTVMFQ